ncbi:hypothetical protein RND71_003091 [Anisodus tanguticus]|uniref:Disease resistance protein At4g27190-like leucine-rich repeats domain-containing protein n=1 Tax=Anisodus tanguticus TaxID=243964 RepID=A0AAE1VWX3_9SOLA|nr:hypothetical protein RND71_003091 [Anisodus tanguticus]
MGGCSMLWRIGNGSPEECCKACLSEIMSLHYLAIICIEVPFWNASLNFHLPNIQNFDITIGYNATICYPSSKTFYFNEIKTQIHQAIINMLQTTEDLTLYCLGDGFLNSIIDVHQESLNRLKILKVIACVNDYFLVDKRPLNASIILGALEELHLSLMNDLQYICLVPYGFISTYSFKKLRILKAEHYRLFITLVTPPLVQRFPSLEEVHVEWCNELRQIFSLENFTEEEQGIFSSGSGHSNRSVCNEGMPGRSNHPSPFWSFPGSRKSEDKGRDILLSKLRKINLDTLHKLQHIWNVIDPLSLTNHHRKVRLDNLTIIEIKALWGTEISIPVFYIPRIKANGSSQGG